LFGLTPKEIGVIFLVLFLAAALDSWRAKLGKNITPKRLAWRIHSARRGFLLEYHRVTSVYSCDSRSFESRQPLATIHTG